MEGGMVVIFSPSPPTAKTSYKSIIYTEGARSPSLLQKNPRNHQPQRWRGLHSGGVAIRITSPSLLLAKTPSPAYHSLIGCGVEPTLIAAQSAKTELGRFKPIEGAVLAAVPISIGLVYGDKMNQKSKAQLNEEIRVLKLKMGILENHVRKLGSDPDCVIIDGMFFASQKKRKTVDELVSGVISRSKVRGKECMAVLNIRDRIKHAVPVDEQKGLTKDIRISLARMELDGIIEVDGNSVKIK